jgi:hypothetical protein
MIEHKIKRGDSLTKIAHHYQLTLNRLLAFNPHYKASPGDIRVGEIVLIPEAKENIPTTHAPAESEPTNSESPVASDQGDFLVPFGQLTFDAEGMEKPGRYFSRILHVPSSSSGVTIGRGYDMKFRSPEEILEDLTASGVPMNKAKKLGACGGYSGKKAKNFMAEKNLSELEISPAQQKALFTVTYKEIEGDVLRICNKVDVVAKYGETHWDELDPVIRDIVIDLRYRGDYTGTTRKLIQPILVENNRSKLKTLMAKEDFWLDRINVPKDRFKRRKNYV